MVEWHCIHNPTDLLDAKVWIINQSNKKISLNFVHVIFFTTFFAKSAKRQMPNKREGGVIIYYIVPIHLLLSLIIIIYIIEVEFFLIWRLAFGKLGTASFSSNNAPLIFNNRPLFSDKAPLLNNLNHHSKKICFFIENNWIIIWIFEKYFVTL